jgi:hypothetical protein
LGGSGLHSDFSAVSFVAEGQIAPISFKVV